MATPHKASTSTLAVATLVALSLLVFAATPSEACGCNARCPCTKPPAAASGGGGKCPVDALKLGGMCANVLGGLLNMDQLLGSRSGSTSTSSSGEQCCGLLGGLADLDVAICLCTALRANVLGLVGVELPVQLSVLVNSCGRKLPSGFKCFSN
ncbi:hypothetical protein E2562_006077 [Oryza meyeriana var. granulata]|uniref:Bifunctional inhibitor/plant lipid transfer protein/seed storage helical domain-containing protein n=1 Tax=Oryza meyeriana var. granulata TaxID=110450 RepID=A0A6G1EVH8_9ORYZ|nr:hypothetical protein E2562_006077 [Oryza meyeriana var. granulata]